MPLALQNIAAGGLAGEGRRRCALVRENGRLLLIGLGSSCGGGCRLRLQLRPSVVRPAATAAGRG